MFNNEMMADVHFVVGPAGGTQRVPGHKVNLPKPVSVSGPRPSPALRRLSSVFCPLSVRPGRGQLRLPRHVLRRAGRGPGRDPDPGRGAAFLPGYAQVRRARG